MSVWFRSSRRDGRFGVRGAALEADDRQARPGDVVFPELAHVGAEARPPSPSAPATCVTRHRHRRVVCVMRVSCRGPAPSPLETASAASALKKATSAVRAIGIGREARVCSCQCSFRLCEGDGERRSPQEARRWTSPTASTALVKSASPSTASASGWRTGKPGREHERVAGDQAGEDRRRRHERERARPAGQDDRKEAEQDGRGDEAEAGARAFLEVIPDERAVDAGADRTGEDDEVGA